MDCPTDFNSPGRADRGPSGLRLTFSLRALLIALTAFAVGFPIWFRWPFVDREQFSKPGAVPQEQRTTTWQRQWGNTKLKHGPETIDHQAGSRTTTYEGEKKEGPYLDVDRRGETRVSGQYVNDMREGIWKEKTVLGQQTAHWHENRLDGLCEVELLSGRKRQWTFAAGRLTHIDGIPVQSRLLELMDAEAIDAKSLAALRQITRVHAMQMPLEHLILYFCESHHIPIVIDSVRVRHSMMRVTAGWGWKGMDLVSALIAVTSDVGLGCDYRYGYVWITTGEDADDWHDPTGVAEIKPTEGTALAEEWRKPISVGMVESPLDEVIDYMREGRPLEIELRWNETTNRKGPPKVTIGVHDRPFHDALGFLLYKSGLRCKLEGDMLVILRADDE